MRTVLEARDLVVDFGGSGPVLNGLNFEIHDGEIVALVGPSGCGKSTLLKCIADLIPATSGETRIVNDADSPPPSMSFVFQDPSLLPWRTVLDNVMLPYELAPKGQLKTVGRTLAEECLIQVGLESSDFTKYPSELSGGMRMRTSLARALISDPTILLLDEPFAALDEFLRNRMNELLLELLNAKSRTMLFVTHNLAEAIYLSHRIFLLANGDIQKILNNPIAWPRKPAVRSSVQFAEFYGEISRKLDEAVRA